MSIAIPAVLAIPVFALITKQVGVELFGIYTLSFAIIGYASIFDLGLSRAVIREVAIHCQNQDNIKQIINTAFSLMLILGVIAFVSIFLLSTYLTNLIGVSAHYYQDVVNGFRLLAVCLPLLLISNIWLAYFEGTAEFKKLSLLRIFAHSGMVVFPLLFSYIEPTFYYLMLGILLARFLTIIISYAWIRKIISIHYYLNMHIAKQLFRFGGWLTVSSVIGPIMVYLDRFVLSAVIGAKSVAFYTAPAELVIRMASIPSAATKTLFVRFSGQSDGQETKIYYLSILILFGGIVLLVLPIFIFSSEVLDIWLGEKFLGDSVAVLRWLLVGLVFNAVAQVPFSVLQAKGHSKITAMLHTAEVLPYVFLLFGLIKSYGIIGVAIAWTVRAIVDTGLLLYFKHRFCD